ncbi:MAG: MBL fold metallo-hydrolase [Solobacterium sp.]|nr:MBL fold metallo-hydrolase [Solobacterium sp.]
MQTKIEYFGHSCFRITDSGKSVIFDPYKDGSVPGLKVPAGLKADAVYCSHGHGDHSAADLITKTSEGDPFATDVITVPHDDRDGTLRGMNDIRFIRTPDCVIAHLGDIGIVPGEDILEKIAEADIVFIPAGGHYTIDAAQAAEIIRRTGVKLVVLMHFRRGKQGYDVLASLDDVLKAFPQAELIDGGVYTAEDADAQKVIVLKPIQ